MTNTIMRADTKYSSGSVVEWLTCQTSNLRNRQPHEFKPCQGQAVVSLSKKLDTDYSVLVGSRNGFESAYIS